MYFRLLENMRLSPGVSFLPEKYGFGWPLNPTVDTNPVEQ
jgi:hypothetical protein